MTSTEIAPAPIWHVVFATSPVTKLVAESWLNAHNIDRNRVICLSRRGSSIPDCGHIIKVKDRPVDCGKFEWLRICAKGSVSIFKQIREITKNEPFILLKAGLRDPREHILHLSKQCLGAYYVEEGVFSHLEWNDQACMTWNSLLIWTYCLLLLRWSIFHLRLSELFLVEGKRLLGHVAISRRAFPGRQGVEVVKFVKVSETSFDAVFLGDPNVEEKYTTSDEREHWLAAVRADLRKRNVRNLGIRIHPSEKIFTYDRYKDFFRQLPDWDLTIELYPHPVDVVETPTGTPLYLMGSSAAIYAKQNGFVVISMKLKPTLIPRRMMKHLERVDQTLAPYVDIWL